MASLAKDTRGAVYVEMLIAFLPVFVFFLGVLQLALLASTKLLVEHAATVGARSAAVVFGDAPGRYHEDAAEVGTLSPNRRKAVRDAVLVALAGPIVDGTVQEVVVLHPAADAPGGRDQALRAPLPPMPPNGATMVRVRVEAKVACKMALVDRFACGEAMTPGGPRVLTARGEALFPYQGASYVYE